MLQRKRMRAEKEKLTDLKAFQLEDLEDILEDRKFLRLCIRTQARQRVELVENIQTADIAETQRMLQMCMDSERMFNETLQDDLAKRPSDVELKIKIKELKSEIQGLCTSSYIERIISLGPPSIVEKMGLYKAQMQEPGYLYDCSFPSDAQPPIPLSLAHPVFGEFLDDFNNVTVPLDDELCNFCLELSYNVLGRMQEFQDEKDFQRAFNQKLEDFLGRSVSMDEVTCRTKAGRPRRLVSDTSVKEKGKWLAMGELKLEKGNTLAQGLQSFALYAGSQDDKAELLPCFYIEITTPIIRIGGFAVFERVAWQPLTPFINGFYSKHEHMDLAMLCRAMRALRRGVNALGSYYREPHPISCKEVPYPLQGRHSRRIGNRLIFVVTREDGEQRIIKFCREYGEDVHRSWAEKNLAPSLYGCRPIPGGWWQVEMQYLADWTPYSNLSERFKHRAAIFTALEKALAIQIDNCPVAHGNMRPSNILVKEVSGGDLDIKFIDFDWAGKIGVAKYPPFMNTETLKWHPGVASGKFLQQEHDRWCMQLPIGACPGPSYRQFDLWP